MTTDRNHHGGLLGTLAGLWPRFQRLPTWARIVAWLFAWPLLVPLWLLSGAPARWRTVAAVASFAVLAFFWSAMVAGIVAGEPPEDADTESVAAETSEVLASATVAATEPVDAESTGEAQAQAASEPTAPPTSSATEAGGAPAGAASAPPVTPSATPAAAAPSAATWSVTRIIDGDTVEVVSADGSMETVRVVGIDTPERGECGFSEAGEAIGRLVLDREVTLVAGAQDDRDRYGRILRYLDVRGVDAGLELIRGGFAISRYDSRDGYGRHDREDRYVEADAAAIHICEGSAPSAGTSPPPAATAAPPTASPAEAPAGPQVQSFPNCDALREVYPGGVARVGVEGNMVSGELRPFRVQPTFDDALYEANRARDRDGDGIACES